MSRAMMRVQRLPRRKSLAMDPAFLLCDSMQTLELSADRSRNNVDPVALTVAVRREVMRLDPARPILNFKTIEQRIQRHPRGRNHFSGVLPACRLVRQACWKLKLAWNRMRVIAGDYRST